MAKHPSLSTRISRTGLVLIATVFLILSVISSSVIWNTYHKQILDSNHVLAASIAKALEEHQNQTKELLNTWSRILNSPRAPLNRQRFLDWIMEDNSRFLRLHFLDTTGKVLHTSPYHADMIGLDYSGEDYFQKTKECKSLFGHPLYFLQLIMKQPLPIPCQFKVEYLPRTFHCKDLLILSSL